ncbi:MAG: TrmH family RNA methyltransferase [Thermoanaerobaculia bacterium]
MERPLRERRTETISSRENRWFRRFLRAAQRHEEEIVLEGPKPIRDALGRGWTPIAFALSGEAEAPKADAPAFRFAPSLARQLTDTVHSQGLLALFHRPEADPGALFRDGAPLIVVLDGVQDPGNVGTVVRLAAAFGATGVALTEGTADAYAPKALRASAGTALALPVVAIGRDVLVAELAKRKIALWATAASGEPRVAIERPAAIAFGSEGQGISATILERARTIAIPIEPGIESINVASAAAIVLNEVYSSSRYHSRS